MQLREADGTPVPVDTLAGSDTTDIDGQIRDMLRSGFLVETNLAQTLAANAGRVIVPLFDSADGLNAPRVHPLGTSPDNAFAWRLPMGGGQKDVFAEVTYRSGTVDTIYDLIMTQPHRVEIVVRHETTGSSATMKDTTVNTSAKSDVEIWETWKILYVPTLRFSVKIYGDSAVATDFDYWLMVSDGDQITPKIIRDNTAVWMMTRPVPASLTGRGVDHLSTYEYEFSLDTTNAQGRANLARLRTGNTLSPVKLMDSALTLRQNLDTLFFLKQSGLNKGKKEFLFVVRHREEFFDDVIINVLGYESEEKVYTEVSSFYRDVYLPQMKLQTLNNPYHLAEGAQISAPFTFALKDTPSVADSGFADIEEIKLLVAKKPPTLAWDPKTTPKTLGVNDLLLMRHYEYPIALEKPAYFLYNILWEDIDPRDWPTGEYLMAVVVRDQYGNEGFAGIWGSSTPKETNPWMVNVVTSY
jgi:hypothetical protein